VFFISTHARTEKYKVCLFGTKRKICSSLWFSARGKKECKQRRERNAHIHLLIHSQFELCHFRHAFSHTFLRPGMAQKRVSFEIRKHFGQQEKLAVAHHSKQRRGRIVFSTLRAPLVKRSTRVSLSLPARPAALRCTLSGRKTLAI
jgi:hypothetical protein